MKRLAIIVFVMVASALPACATSDLNCYGKDQGGREVSMNFEWGAGIASVFEMTVVGEVFVTPGELSPKGARAIIVRHANDDAMNERIGADFSLSQDGAIVAGLRTYKFQHKARVDWDDNRVSAGVYWFKDIGEWQVLCDTP